MSPRSGLEVDKMDMGLDGLCGRSDHGLWGLPDAAMSLRGWRSRSVSRPSSECRGRNITKDN